MKPAPIIVPNQSPMVTGAIIARNPVIILAGANGAESAPASYLSHEAFIEQPGPVFFFINPMWTLSSRGFRERVFGALASAKRRAPQHVYTLLINDWRDAEFCNDLAARYFVCGEHAAADPAKFRYVASPQTYNAVYIASAHPYKRIELAASVERLCLLSKGITAQKLDAIREHIPSVVCPNVDGQVARNLAADEVAATLNQAGCGLILSDREGQNRATIEYLLCGLPVVSTPGAGGRDRFLHPGNSVFARPDRSEIGMAVEFVSRSAFDRAAIAAAASAAVRRERVWLAEIIRRTLADQGFAPQQLNIPHHAFSRANYVASELHHLGWS